MSFIIEILEACYQLFFKEQTPNPHQITAAITGNFKVITHAHGKLKLVAKALGQDPGVLFNGIKALSGALFALIGANGGHDHQTLEVKFGG